MRLRLEILALAALALLAIVPVAPGATSSQRFFRSQLLKDPKTGAGIRQLLLHDGGFVDPNVIFTDLTGDKRADAIVVVSSGGAAGDVALYVFSTDGSKQTQAKLRAVYRSQSLYRADVRVRNGVLGYGSPRYSAGDELCCPAATIDYDLRWNKATGTFRLRRASQPQAG